MKFGGIDMTNQNVPYTSQSVIGIISPNMMLPLIKETLRGFPNLQANYFIIHAFEINEELTTFITQHDMLVVTDSYIYQQLKIRFFPTLISAKQPGHSFISIIVNTSANKYDTTL